LRQKKYLKLDQTKYIKEFVEEYLGDEISTNVKKSMLPTNNYCVLQIPATGKIRYCADKSRPDILFAINMISTQTEKPHDEFVGATMKLLKYLSIFHQFR
jgi:hypothetical protein